MTKVATGLESVDIADTDDYSFTIPPGSRGADVTVTGVGSGSAQPVFRDSNSDHQAYTIADDTYDIGIPELESIDVTASGGAIWVQVAPYK